MRDWLIPHVWRSAIVAETVPLAGQSTLATTAGAGLTTATGGASSPCTTEGGLSFERAT